MSQPPRCDRKRLAALLADRAVFGLDDARQRELDRLAAASPGADLECFDRVAAAVALLGVSGRLEPMPASLRRAVGDSVANALRRSPQSLGH